MSGHGISDELASRRGETGVPEREQLQVGGTTGGAQPLSQDGHMIVRERAVGKQ